MSGRLRRLSSLVVAAGVCWLATAAGAEPKAGDPATGSRYEQTETARTGSGRWHLDRSYSAGRLLLGAAGLGAFVVWRRQRSRAPGSRGERAARLALVVLGIAAYGSYFYFFRFTHLGGFDTRDALHYYVGSKYFSELGHFGLYECTLAALTEEGLRPIQGVRGVRDLRTLGIVPAAEVIERGRDCNERFTPERWQAFRRDVRWFRARIPRHLWPQFLIDHGYHPTPVWTLVGGGLANRIEADSMAMWAAVRFDRVLIAGGLVALAWGFGPEIGALAAVVWGTGYPWRYSWVGDAYLRHLWLTAVLVGLALLRRRRHLGAGAALTLSALLRIFPGVFLASWSVHALRRALVERRLEAGAARVVAGGAIAALLLVGASIAVIEQGVGAYTEFAQKISVFTAHTGSNRMGLSFLVDACARATGGTVPRVVWDGLFVALILVFGWLYLRALPRLRSWEAAALGFAWIPMLTEPTNYYYSFVVTGLLLGRRHPRAAVWVAMAGLLWGLNGLAFYLEWREFLGASLIAVALSFAVVAELGWGRADVEPTASRF